MRRPVSEEVKRSKGRTEVGDDMLFEAQGGGTEMAGKEQTKRLLGWSTTW